MFFALKMVCHMPQSGQTRPYIRTRTLATPLPDDFNAMKKRKFFDPGFWLIVGLASISGTLVLLLRGPAVFFDLMGADIVFALLLLPKILGGIILASCLSLLIPRDRIKSMVGADSGLRGLAIATLAGAIVPGGPSVSVPLAAGLMASGADLGATFAMLCGFMMLGAERILIWELSFMPADMVALRVLVALPFPFLVGLAARHLVRRRDIAANKPKVPGE